MCRIPFTFSAGGAQTVSKDWYGKGTDGRLIEKVNSTPSNVKYYLLNIGKWYIMTVYFLQVLYYKGELS